MNISVESIGALERRMTVAVPADTIDREIDTRLNALAGRAKISGFRPGKVPMKVIRDRFDSQVRQEVLGDMIQRSFFEALSKNQLRPAGTPTIEPRAREQGQALEYTATFEIYPEIKVAELSAISITRPVATITDADVDVVLERMRKQRLTWQAADRGAREGDRVVCDFEGTVDGQPFQGNTGTDVPVELGAKRFIPGFEEQLIGAMAGEERTLAVTFPENYPAEHLAGKPASFKVTIKRIEASQLPAIDEAFAASFGITEGGVANLRSQVRENMQREADQVVRGRLKQQVMEQLLAANAFDVPKALVESEIDALLEQQGMKALGDRPEVARSAFAEQARRRVALGLLMSEIIRANNIKVSPAAVRSTVEGIAAGYEYPDEVIKYYYADKNRLAQIENLALEEEVVGWIISKARVSDENVAFDALMNPGQTRV